MRSLLIASTVALALAGCAPKAANTTTDLNATAMGDSSSGSGGNMVDGNVAMASAPMTTDDFLKKAAMSDMFEVQEGKLAETSAVSPALKDFGKKMVAGHTDTTKALKAAVAKDGVKMTPPAALDEKHQALYDALKAAKGANFDALYKAQQTDSHADALATMKSYSASGDKPAIKAFATETTPKVQMHIDMLSKI